MKVLDFITITDRSGQVRLNEAVTQESAERVIEEMDRLYGGKAVQENMRVGEVYAEADDALERLDIEIHSPGGQVFDGWRMYQAVRAMRDRGVYVTATINSLAASMASVVAMAADEVRIVRGGKMMIHEASSLTFGTAQDHRSAAENLEEISGTISGVYAERTGKPAEEMRELMRDETWIGAEQAVEIGLADKMVSGAVDSAEFDTPEKSMGLLSKKTDERIEARDAQISELTSELSAAITAKEDAEGRLQEAGDRITEATATIARQEEELNEQKTLLTAADNKIEELSAEATKLEKAAEVSAEKISEEAANLLAGQGHPQPVDLDAAGDKPADVWSEMAAISDPAKRTAFWKANRQKMLASVRSK